MYIAHINEYTKQIQTIKEHSENVAMLCRKFAVPELKDLMYIIGILHDIGKYQSSFQKRIQGDNVRVEHSICGAIVAHNRYLNSIALIIEHCIAGHHSGLADTGFFNDTKDMSTLHGRLKRTYEPIDSYARELEVPNIDNSEQLLKYIVNDCDNDSNKLIDKFAFLVRYCFSCLTDADSLDTAKFCNGDTNRKLTADFVKCLKKIDDKLASFSCITELQKTRAKLQKQAFDCTAEKSEIYLLNMPTGSGKTLCSVKFALERAIKEDKKRIIYIIPYNSIIEQTANEFEAIFKDDAEILRHQSTFSYDDKEDLEEDYRVTVKLAIENWDAQFIITTAVQFFESIYANKRGKLRKLHNMADSILVFDEAHLMPKDYLQPCLEAVSYITRYLNSEAVFLTATMPDFKNLIAQYAISDTKIYNLVDDTSGFEKFNKCKYKYIGNVSDDSLISYAEKYPSSLIIVNKRKKAKQIFEGLRGRKFHLSTYMTAYDRERVITRIKEELCNLEKEYPDYRNVPEERRITVVSTSLIEAGVDLDFFTVFREMAGLDNILQSGGRCNREGKRENAEVFIFEFDSEFGKASADERTNITKGLIKKYGDITNNECVEEYYDKLFFINHDNIVKNSMHQFCKSFKSIPFREYAQRFELIDSKTVSVVVARDEKSRAMLEQLREYGYSNQRILQKYAFSIYQYEFDDLYRQNIIDDYDSGIWCLTNTDYYDEETGILFEAKDYFI